MTLIKNRHLRRNFCALIEIDLGHNESVNSNVEDAMIPKEARISKSFSAYK